MLLLCNKGPPSFHLQSPQKKLKNVITTFLCHGPLYFPTIPPLLPLSLQNMLDYVVDHLGLKIRLLGTSTSLVTLPFFALV